jgi:cell division protein FtsW
VAAIPARVRELRIDDISRAAAPARYDRVVLLLVGALMTLGAVMVYSASVTLQGAQLRWQQWWNTPLRQCVFAVAGFIAMIVAAHVDYRILEWRTARRGWLAVALYLLSAGLLVAVLLVGSERMGAQRTLVVVRSPLTLGFQPSELAKVMLIIWLAAFLTRPGADVRALASGFLPAMLTAGLLIVLTGVEDFGTAALMGVVTLLMLYLSGARLWHLAGTILLGGVAGVGLILLKPYRVTRIVTFLSDAPDPSGEGYQVTQSLIAIGSGGWLGRGIGAGVQKYGYLPQDNNDFVLAVLCEELGVTAGIAVAVVFLLLLWRGWLIAVRSDNRFGSLLAGGVAITLGLQAAFNIAVVSNSVPTKGISLPFVSAGGSGVLFLGAAAGLLASVARSAANRASGPQNLTG